MSELELDVIVRWDGFESLVQLEMMSQQAEDWVDQFIDPDPRHWLGNRLCINPLELEAVVEGLVADGLAVGVPKK